MEHNSLFWGTIEYSCWTTPKWARHCINSPFILQRFPKSSVVLCVAQGGFTTMSTPGEEDIRVMACQMFINNFQFICAPLLKKEGTRPRSRCYSCLFVLHWWYGCRRTQSIHLSITILCFVKCIIIKTPHCFVISSLLALIRLGQLFDLCGKLAPFSGAESNQTPSICISEPRPRRTSSGVEPKMSRQSKPTHDNSSTSPQNKGAARACGGDQSSQYFRSF